MTRVIDRLLRVTAPLVPDDIRRDWLREWRAEFACRSARAGRMGRPLPARSLWYAAGAVPHALWLRWDRWRLEMVWQDVRYAVRVLFKKPGFAVATLLTLAIGIGANAAIFGVVRAVLLRPLPFPDPDALVTVSTTSLEQPDRMGGSSAPPDFVDWRRDVGAFAEMAAINANASALTGDGTAEQVPNAEVTGGFFTVLGVRPLYGRTLLPEDDPITAPQVAVLSHRLWARRFGSRPAVVGESIVVDGTPTRVAGVMPAGFDYPLGAEIWLPLRFDDEELRTQRGAQYLDVIARLEAGVSLGAAQGEMRAYAGHLADLYPRNNRGRTASLFAMRDAMVGDVRPAMLMLLGAVAFVLLIVCVNVASLFLTRALGRQRELAVRMALGAGRASLVRGLVVESLLVGVGGGLAGLLIATWAIKLIAALDVDLGIPLLNQTRVDGTVLAFAAFLSLTTALLVGALPAWHASATVDVARRIREDAGTTTGDRHRQRLRSSLIVAETALAVVLLVGAGLLMRSFLGMAAVELGFDDNRVQVFNLSLPDTRYPNPADRAAFQQALLSRLSAHPQVEAAGAIFGLPLTGFGYTISMSTLDDRPIVDDDEQMQKSLRIRVVSPDYFRAMGIPVRRGRTFGNTEGLGSPSVALVNEAAADLLWPDADPLGHTFTLGTRLGQGGLPAGGTVIGVAGDVREDGPVRATRPTVFLSHAQFPVSFFSVALKARGEAGALVEPARGLLRQLDPDLPMFQVRTMARLAANAVARPRLYLVLLGIFAGVAVGLAAIGIYGVLAHSVSQRTREIGIRLALGAPRRQVIGSVVVQAGGMALGGLAVGLLLAAAAGQLIQSLLFGVQPIDSLTYGLVAGGLAAVVLLASLLPARRASRVDPVIALRHE